MTHFVRSCPLLPAALNGTLNYLLMGGHFDADRVLDRKGQNNDWLDSVKAVPEEMEGAGKMQKNSKPASTANDINSGDQSGSGVFF